MATQLEQARAGKITAEMEAVAARDGMTPQQIRQGVEEG
ncbi:MAG: phosphomethylpyrimidine synthase ThiC, partial [Thermoleophilia bacterium]